MKKLILVLISFVMIVSAPCTAYAYKQTKNNLKGCNVSGCKHTRFGDGYYCSDHKCAVYECNSLRETNSKYCHKHKGTTAKKTMVYGKEEKSTYTYKKTKKSSTSTSKSKWKTYDPYDASEYKDADSFADDKYEEFLDYEDYDDEDEAYDAAVDYWNDYND